MSEQTTIYVDVMTCENCVRHVSVELGEISGVSAVAVELVAGGTSPVTLTSEGPVSPQDIAAAVDEAGYTVAPR